MNQKIPLVAIVGPTASGKTSLAIKIAKKYGGEILCADSRTIYREMDIGTAKPTQTEQMEVPHWGLDLVSPGERFTVADYQDYANKKIADIRLRKKVPILAGGTGLYVDAVLYDFEFGREVDQTSRQRYEELTVEQLQVYCNNNNIILPENFKNKRYLINAIERNGTCFERSAELSSTSYVVGIATESKILRAQIKFRSEQMFSGNVVEEASYLAQKYGWNHEAMTGNIYPLIRSFIEGAMDMTEMKKRFEILDWHLAKRQMTWFRKNPHIQWGTLSACERFIDRLLV